MRSDWTRIKNAGIVAAVLSGLFWGSLRQMHINEQRYNNNLASVVEYCSSLPVPPMHKALDINRDGELSVDEISQMTPASVGYVFNFAIGSGMDIEDARQVFVQLEPDMMLQYLWNMYGGHRIALYESIVKKDALIAAYIITLSDVPEDSLFYRISYGATLLMDIDFEYEISVLEKIIKLDSCLFYAITDYILDYEPGPTPVPKLPLMEHA